jgi:hypothetical protein
MQDLIIGIVAGLLMSMLAYSLLMMTILE